MKLKILFTLFAICKSFVVVEALVINEIMSNPAGDDSGREWIEIYNDTTETVDVSNLTISVKGGVPVSTFPVSGGVSIPPFGYGIIGSVVGGATKFSLDYPSYSGPLLRSSISLVNTGVTSLDIRLNSTVVHSVASYTAAKEGSTYSLLQGLYGLGTPTPGVENQPNTTSTSNDTGTTTTNSNQVTVPQMSPPNADIALYLPSERLVIAGAPSIFSVYAQTFAGKAIDNVKYTWSFGDGGQKTGSSTLYRYLYPGRYILQVEGTNGLMAATGRTTVRVVAPEILISHVQSGKYGPYVEVSNPNTYDIDISEWKLSIDGALFSFPKNTLAGIGHTKFSGEAMGFASATVTVNSVVKLLFSNMEEVVRVNQKNTDQEIQEGKKEIKNTSTSTLQTVTLALPPQKKLVKIKTATPNQTLSTTSKIISVQQKEKDVRIASFIRSLFSK